MDNQIREFDETNVFNTKGKLSEYYILNSMIHINEPVGSWVLKNKLEEFDLEVSTATIGRILKRLDQKGYTELIVGKGRILTRNGLNYARQLLELIERKKLQNKLFKATRPYDLKELIDLLHARKVLECESARMAALRATPEDIEIIENILSSHEKCVLSKNDPTTSAFDFHEKIAEISQNQFLIAVLRLLIFEEVKLEADISELITRERGSEYVIEHREIVGAIKKKNPKLASEEMKKHMLNLIKAIEEQIKMS